MKKIIWLIVMALPLVAFSKGTVDAKYLAGGVPEKNNVVTFSKSFTVENKSKDEIVSALSSYMNNLTKSAIESQRTRMISDGSEDGTVVAKVEEYMVFTKKALNFDRTRFRYQISAAVEGNTVNVTLSQVSYYYNEDMEGNNGITYKAEEWITDKEALNSKGTKLLPRSKKFRIKTIDRVEAIFNSILDVFDTNKDAKTGENIRGGVKVVK